MLSKSLENKNYWQFSISVTTTLLFILQTVLIILQSMSTKKQISSLCKLCSVYEELPEEIMDETRRELLLSQHFGHFTVPPPNSLG